MTRPPVPIHSSINSTTKKNGWSGNENEMALNSHQFRHRKPNIEHMLRIYNSYSRISSKLDVGELKKFYKKMNTNKKTHFERELSGI